MSIYISSSGEEIDTSTMNFIYLQNALRKAYDRNDTANIAILEAEMALRDQNV